MGRYDTFNDIIRCKQMFKEYEFLDLHLECLALQIYKRDNRTLLIDTIVDTLSMGGLSIKNRLKLKDIDVYLINQTLCAISNTPKMQFLARINYRTYKEFIKRTFRSLLSQRIWELMNNFKKVKKV